MALDPRRFTVKACPKVQATKIASSTARKDFFGALGKVGDIEVLNRFGDGDVSAGLRDLASISDGIRTGDTSSAIIGNDNGYVFNALAINQNEATKAGQFNPGILNRATAQADVVLDSVKAGNFKLSDIPDVSQDFQNLTRLMGGILTDDSGHTSTRDLGVCGASPYAIDLVQYAPKYKFLFIVQVTLDPSYSELGDSADKLAFVVKTSTRPNINIEHEEVNMYNFWTRVPKRAVYEPITMRFYDDNKGIAHLFYTSYLRSLSPISRLGGMDSGSGLNTGLFEENSRNFNSASTQSSASLTALEGNAVSIIKEIKLFHIYDYGKFMNVYHFYNPKLLTMNLDDLDVAENAGGNEIELQFAYDAMHITPAFSVQQDPNRITDLTGGKSAAYPITPEFIPGAVEKTPFGISGADGIPSPTITNIDTSSISNAFTNINIPSLGDIPSVNIPSASDIVPAVPDFPGSRFA